MSNIDATDAAITEDFSNEEIDTLLGLGKKPKKTTLLELCSIEDSIEIHKLDTLVELVATAENLKRLEEEVFSLCAKYGVPVVEVPGKSGKTERLINGTGYPRQFVRHLIAAIKKAAIAGNPVAKNYLASLRVERRT